MAFDKTIKALAEAEQNQWKVGDALVAEVRAKADWDDLSKALVAAGIEHTPSTLRAYRRVAAGFPRDQRVTGVSFGAHQAALTAGDAAGGLVAIDRARTNTGRATRDAVLAEVRAIKGRASNAVSDALVAWRDLTRAVGKLLDVPESELEALLIMDGGKYAGRATDLVRDMGKVQARIGASITVAEKALLKASKPKLTGTQAPAAKPKAQAPANKPKIGKLGKGRGQG